MKFKLGDRKPVMTAGYSCGLFVVNSGKEGSVSKLEEVGPYAATSSKRFIQM